MSYMYTDTDTHQNSYTDKDKHMYPSSTSSSSQKPMGSTGLTRYVSAPGSLLTTAVDAVVGADRDFAAIGSRSVRGQYFAGDSSSVTSESTCEVKPPYNSSNTAGDAQYRGLQRSYRLDEMSLTSSQLKNVAVGVVNGVGETCSSSSSSALLRQRSSPAGFLSHLNVNAHKNGASDNGYSSVSRVAGSYHSSQGGDDSGHRVSRLKSQLSFTGPDSSSSSSHASKLSRNNADGITSENSHLCYATTSFGMDAWDQSNTIVFSAPSNKRAKNYDGDICFNTLESQFSLPQTSLEMETVERLLNIPEDSVPCKIRAKRGCATHPRSIAERERRTRISGKLKKLQDLVPNMDKQTSYADMLDLAVQHIKGLQGQVQKLQKEMENCKCG